MLRQRAHGLVRFALAWQGKAADVKPAFPELAPVPGREYFVGQTEKHNQERVWLLQVAKQAIDGR